MWSPTPSDPYANGEFVRVNAVNASTLTVTRNVFATGAVAFSKPPLIAAAPAGPIYPLPEFNLSDMAPVNPVTGQRANQWLAANIVSNFASSSPSNPTLDGVEFDAASWEPHATNVNGDIKNLDCDGDGSIDYCNRGVGTIRQVNSYGVGYDSFVQAVKSGLAQYNTDSTRPKMVLGDGEFGFRSTATANGAEFESFPAWDDYDRSSSALADLTNWQQQNTASGPHLSYALTMDNTPLYGQPSALNPSGCITPAMGGTCRNGSYRFGLASGLMSGGASAYHDEADSPHPVPWDEEATINQQTTGLAPGYLGSALGPAERATRYRSGELATNPSMERDLASITSANAVGSNLTVVRDTTTSAPGKGLASLRGDVTALSPDPWVFDARVQQTLASPIQADQEYAVEFWAKGTSSADGPPGLDLGVSLSGVQGASQKVNIGPQWTHYYLQLHPTTVPSGKSMVKFFVGNGVGSYWLDGISVHQGTAGILTRQYANGVVVLNDSFTDQADIALPGGPYHHIDGVQDRSVNDGSPVGSTLPTVGSKDGQILLRG
jgi:hypothetical protein